MRKLSNDFNCRASFPSALSQEMKGDVPYRGCEEAAKK